MILVFFKSKTSSIRMRQPKNRTSSNQSDDVRKVFLKILSGLFYDRKHFSYY